MPPIAALHTTAYVNSYNLNARLATSNTTMMVLQERDGTTAVQLQWHSRDIECDSGEVACAAAMEGSIAKTAHAMQASHMQGSHRLHWLLPSNPK